MLPEDVEITKEWAHEQDLETLVELEKFISEFGEDPEYTEGMLACIRDEIKARGG